MKNQEYLTPRLAIATLTSHTDTTALSALSTQRHKSYHHFFNLSQFKFPQTNSSDFKWRGLPFSMTETLKILTQVDAFLRTNIANTAFICTTGPDMHQYARFICKTYLEVCQLSLQSGQTHPACIKMAAIASNVIKSQPYLTRQILQIYRNIEISSPPVKILESLEVTPSSLFVPISDIYTQGRYNQYELVYTHPIQQQLATYYLQLNRPLETGIGGLYYDQKPQTKYFHQPVIVYGDIKISIYSYKHLTKMHQFTIGFNTHNIDALMNNSGQLVLEDVDLYDKNKEIQGDVRVKIGFSDFCSGNKCKNSSSCNQCREMVKKLTNRYSECQSDLQKLHRARTPPEVAALLSL